MDKINVHVWSWISYFKEASSRYINASFFARKDRPLHPWRLKTVVGSEILFLNRICIHSGLLLKSNSTDIPPCGPVIPCLNMLLIKGSVIRGGI